MTTQPTTFAKLAYAPTNGVFPFYNEIMSSGNCCGRGLTPAAFCVIREAKVAHKKGFGR